MTDKILIVETEAELRKAYNDKVTENLKLKQENFRLKLENAKYKKTLETLDALIKLKLEA